MKAIILEDEQLATNRLLRLIREVAPDVNVVANFESIKDTIEYLDDNDDIDLLFLDIHVADGNSFELFELKQIKGNVVFTTAYNKYAIEAFRKNATDYLLKPIRKEHLVDAIEKAAATSIDHSKNEENKYRNRILIKFMSKIHSLKTADIAYIFSKNKISYFYTKSGDRYPSDIKLLELEEMLDPSLFFRANRQFLIHIDALDKIVRHQGSRLRITLKPIIDEELVISTDKTPFFKEWLEQ
ncbi:MAG: two-component system response regulator LytT [Saprospiraceae bacterium]|jgi:two-component system response regulator LytT